MPDLDIPTADELNWNQSSSSVPLPPAWEPGSSIAVDLADQEAAGRLVAALLEAPTDGEAPSVSKKRPDSPPATVGDGKQPSKASLAIQLAVDAEAELFHNAEGKTFGSVWVNDHLETWTLKSSSFRKWLAARFWTKYKSSIHPPAIAEALLALEGRATYEGPIREVFTRIAEYDNAIYLDLCDDKWRVVEVKATGWNLVESGVCPVRFRRSSGMLPLPAPDREGDISELRPLLNLSDDDSEPQWVLILSWLIAALRPGAPYPVLAVYGEQGSAKSTTCRMLRALIDPNTAALRSPPKEERDLMIAASNSHIVAFDNLAHLSDGLSDALCRLSTGGGFATRELYSNDDEVIFDLKRPILLNGITEIVTKSDLLDRSVLISLPRIPENRRREESTIWQEFGAARPRILGAILEAGSIALRELPNTALERLPRMADFARWATAAETGLGLKPGAFLNAYDRNRSEANDIALDASPVAVELRAMFIDRSSWEGRSADLLKDLTGQIERRNENPKTKNGWPQTARKLTDTLKILAPNLRNVGIDFQLTRSKNGRGVRLVKTENFSAINVTSVTNQSTQQVIGDAVNGRGDVAPQQVTQRDDGGDAGSQNGDAAKESLNGWEQSVDDAVTQMTQQIPSLTVWQADVRTKPANGFQVSTLDTPADDPNVTPAGWTSPF